MEEKAQRSKELASELPGLVFMGTPDFAVPSLRGLAAAGAPVVLAVTQPDRPKGRGKKLSPPPVRIWAESLNIPVYQPERIRAQDALDRVSADGVPCAVVVAYGQLLPSALLHAFPLGVLNVHASLLPRYRGAAPIHRAILAGETLTGVSIMLLDEGMDTGPILAQRQIPIAATDTFGTLHDTLAEAGAELLRDTLMQWRSGLVHPRPQDDALATYAPPLQKQESHLNWQLPAAQIVNVVRAFDPWPGAFTFYEGKRVKCFGALTLGWSAEGEAGEIIGCGEDGLVVLAGDHQAFSIGELQLEGQRRLRAADFIRGRAIKVGCRLA